MRNGETATAYQRIDGHGGDDLLWKVAHFDTFCLLSSPASPACCKISVFFLSDSILPSRARCWSLQLPKQTGQELSSSQWGRSVLHDPTAGWAGHDDLFWQARFAEAEDKPQKEVKWKTMEPKMRRAKSLPVFGSAFTVGPRAQQWVWCHSFAWGKRPHVTTVLYMTGNVSKKSGRDLMSRPLGLLHRPLKCLSLYVLGSLGLFPSPSIPNSYCLVSAFVRVWFILSTPFFPFLLESRNVGRLFAKLVQLHFGTRRHFRLHITLVLPPMAIAKDHFFN